MDPTCPVIVEAAINGMCSKSRNPAVPKGTEEIVADALACLENGAAIIHVHASSFELSIEQAIAEYAAIFRAILRERPDAHLYPTGLAAATLPERIAHFQALVEQGLITMGYFDPGTVNIAAEQDEQGLPVGGMAYVNTYDECRQAFRLFARWRLGPSLAIYEPGFLRVVTAYARAGQLPAGSMIKFYFGGGYSPFSGRPAVTHGLPPTPPSLDALLGMCHGIDLPWAVGAFGGDIGQSSVLPYALELGGHVRLGLEDYAGERAPSNVELIRELGGIARRQGRRLATPDEAGERLGLPLRRGHRRQQPA